MLCFYVLPKKMTTLFSLTLYTTAHCHLCEDASALLESLALGVDLHYIDIAGDNALMDAFATRIPVLERSDNKVQLNWPFTESEILAFV